jgi:hypothetical protein
MDRARRGRSLFMAVVIVFCFGGLVAGSSGSAQIASPATEPAGYRQIVSRAVREFDAGNYAEARGLFNRAHELQPSARTHLGLGLTEFELRNYGTSIAHLEQALAATVKPLDATLRKSAEDVLGKARDMIGKVQLEVKPHAGRVLVDGVPVELVDGQSLLLEVGDHTIEVQTSGYLPERRSLSIVGGEQVKVSVVMHVPESPPGPVAQAEPSQAPRAGREQDDRAAGERRWYKSPWLWIGIGAVAVAGGVTAGLLLRPEATTEAAQPTLSDTTPPGGVLSLGRR